MAQCYSGPSVESLAIRGQPKRPRSSWAGAGSQPDFCWSGTRRWSAGASASAQVGSRVARERGLTRSGASAGRTAFEPGAWAGTEDGGPGSELKARKALPSPKQINKPLLPPCSTYQRPHTTRRIIHPPLLFRSYPRPALCFIHPMHAASPLGRRAQSHALALPEIRSLICAELDTPALLQTALVSRCWRDPCQERIFAAFQPVAGHLHRALALVLPTLRARPDLARRVRSLQLSTPAAEKDDATCPTNAAESHELVGLCMNATEVTISRKSLILLVLPSQVRQRLEPRLTLSEC